MKKKLISAFILLLNSYTLFSQDGNTFSSTEAKLEELNDLRCQKIITEEDFQVLQKEITGEEENKEEFYDLSINSKLVSKTYKIIKIDGKQYFPLKEFFKYINFGNYKINKESIIVYLGSALRKEKIDFPKDGFFTKNEIYIESKKFNEIFLSDEEIEEKQLKIRMYLSFDTPKEIMQLVDVNKEKLLKNENKNELIFQSEKKLFDLGYTRIQLGKTFDKEAGKQSYKNSWDGQLSYQGGLLYGEITADYDLKEKEFNTIRLEYDDIWKGHTLDIENRKYNKSREWGLELYKDKSFYEDAGGEIVISERVPIGSRVELLYMGTPIDIKDDINGKVEFSNPLIRTDRTYTLKIYEPDGKIIEKEIKTVKDYYLQKRGEFEYRVGINEKKQYNRYETYTKLFYGITDRLTVGLGYERKIEDIVSKNNENKIKYLNNITSDIVYGGTYNGLSYTFNLNTENALNNTDVLMLRNGFDEQISIKDRYRYKYLNQFNYKKWKLIYENEDYGKYYEENKRKKIDLEYTASEHLNLGYEWEKTKYRVTKEGEQKKVFTINTDHLWRSILFSAGTELDADDNRNNIYRLSAYYSGWTSLAGRIENVWLKNGKEYETKLTLYNNSYKGFLDFSSELSYSNKNKEKLTFTISIKLDDWLTIDNSFNDTGARNHRIGIDKVIDLKKPTLKIDSIDTSRVKVITFIDKNNNNIYDPDEERVSNVEVKIGNDKVITNKNGEGMFYGISNGNLYDLKVTIKKPSFTLGENILKIRSKFSSTVDAYIPIKPMLTLSGHVILDKSLNLKEDEKEDFYSELIIEVKDLTGKVIETTLPDNEGLFDVSGLFPKDYYIEVTYVGSKYDLKTIKEDIKLQYSANSSDNQIMLKVSNEYMAIQKLNHKFAKLGR